ncbi:MAG: type II secretion system protein [Planctomycetes bacterium]|nr:type II secretion system protein [Planctomycetota bacterium]
MRYQIEAVPRKRGAVLLEVVVAMAIFFGCATIILGGLRNSIAAWESVKLESQAADLAISLVSEIQMGIREPASDGPRAYDAPLADWTWQVVVSPPAGLNQDLSLESQLIQVDAIVTHSPTGYARRQTVILPGASEEETAAVSSTGGGQ